MAPNSEREQHGDQCLGAGEIRDYWHCVAAQLESGQINETGNQVTPFDFDKGLEAYRDWCRRHPESKPR